MDQGHNCNHENGNDCKSCSHHTAEGGCVQQPETVADVLKAIKTLNQQSSVKMLQFSEKLKEIGREDTVKHLEKCVDEYRKGEMWLAAAISSLET